MPCSPYLAVLLCTPSDMRMSGVERDGFRCPVLLPHDHCPRELVMPALLAGIKGHPEIAKTKRYQGEVVCEVASDQLASCCSIASFGINNFGGNGHFPWCCLF